MIRPEPNLLGVGLDPNLLVSAKPSRVGPNIAQEHVFTWPITSPRLLRQKIREILNAVAGDPPCSQNDSPTVTYYFGPL
jgi:hypothetical protein